MTEWRTMIEQRVEPEREIAALKLEIERLRADLLTRDGQAQELQGEVARLSIEGVAWEGDVGDAMAAAVKEIERLRKVLRDDRREWQMISDATKGAADVRVRGTAFDRLCAIDEALGE